MSGGLHARSGSIKRTPSDLSLSLAAADLPPPSAITAASTKDKSDAATAGINQKIGDLDLDEPEDRKRESDRAQEAVANALSSLELGIPERISRANAKADGATTPIPVERTEGHSRNSTDVEVEAQGEATEGEQAGAQVVTPWDVQGATVEGKQVAIDYNKLIDQFGTKPISAELLARFEKLTGHKPHLLLRRGTFFSHREFDQILDRYEQKKPFYLYTGRGPSSDSFHLGHMIPFVFTQWLQKVFNVPLVIQLTDDEKFLFKPDLKLEQCNGYAYQNARDVIACGFDKEKTFIFSDLDYVGPSDSTLGAYPSLLRHLACLKDCKIDIPQRSDNIGKWHFVAIQATPSFSNSFPQIFGTKTDIPCLIPCAIDQDPYFRLTREAAQKLRYKKPALIHAKFIPSLLGAQSKMSASVDSTSIFMTDTQKKIKDKINKYAFSGGGATLEEHREKGGNPDVDVAYQYLTFFLEDDEELAKIEQDYRTGTLTTGDLKAKTIVLIQQFVKDFQERKAAVTDDVVKYFMDPNRTIVP
ncbi:tryptophanyl-tRNA synthetase, partial [Phenoliferia sp. Uapishka_3]